MSTMKSKPVALHPSEAQVIDHLGGEKITMLLTGQDTDGKFAMIIDEVPPGEGPPLHIHHNEDETFYVLEGELELQVDEERFVVSAGSSIFMPRGIPHTFRNSGTQTAKSLVILTPSNLEGFFAEVEPLVSQDEPNMNAVLDIAGKYGLEIIGPPLGDD